MGGRRIVLSSHCGRTRKSRRKRNGFTSLLQQDPRGGGGLGADYAVMISLATPEGGKAGVPTEAPRPSPRDCWPKGGRGWRRRKRRTHFMSYIGQRGRNTPAKKRRAGCR